jgi:hypothetical protein
MRGSVIYVSIPLGGKIQTYPFGVPATHRADAGACLRNERGRDTDPFDAGERARDRAPRLRRLGDLAEPDLAAISSSGFVPVPSSKREANEQPPVHARSPTVTRPAPLLRSPVHLALPLRVAMTSLPSIVGSLLEQMVREPPAEREWQE